MKNKSIRRLFAKDAEDDASAVSAASGPQDASDAVSAAERLGRWLLDSLGAADDGVTEDELVDAILNERTAAGDSLAEPEEEEERDEGAAPQPVPDEDGDLPFEPAPRRPRHMRTGGAQSAPVDYSDMSAEQFRSIRKLLKKAAADGRRIKL